MGRKPSRPGRGTGFGGEDRGWWRRTRVGGVSRGNFHGYGGRIPMWISLVWYSFRLFGSVWVVWDEIDLIAKIRSFMRKTIVINVLLILGYYLILQLLIWVAMIFR